MENISSCNIPRNLSSIQSFGYVFILDAYTLKITGISENILSDLNYEKHYLFDEVKNFTEILTSFQQQEIYNYLLYKTDSTKTTRIILLTNGVSYYAHIYRSQNYLILELEEKQENITLSFNEINKLHDDIHVSEYSKKKIVNIVKKLTNFKRVLLYEFTSEWDGHVTVEQSEYKDVKFQDVYFYKTDIPMYVRGLFCKNHTRYIHDREDKGVNILWKESPGVFDSKMSEIIASKSSHNNYLKSLDVSSSFSLAVIAAHKLWGLVICHNDSPMYLNPFIRNQCKLFVEMFSENLNNVIKFKEKNFNEYVYKLYKFINIYNFISSEELNDINTLVLEQMSIASDCDLIIGNYANKVVDKTHLLNLVIRENLNTFNDYFISNNAPHDLFQLLGIKIPFSTCQCILLIKLDEKYWIGFVKIAREIKVNWAGSGEILKRGNISFPRQNFNFVEKNRLFYEPFKLSKQNIEYLRQLLVFLNDRLNDSGYLTEYFVSHNTEYKNFLTSNILHDIRNPLNAMSGLFDILNDKKEYDQSLVDDGIKITHDILELSSNLININKFQNTENMSIKTVNWDKIIENCIKTYKYMLSKDVKINYVIDEKSNGLSSDPVKIQQLLSNLISNAVKFTTKGSINIFVEVINNIENTWWVKVVVKDTGCGIPMDKQINLFKLFEQISENFIHSSGLGLIICSKLVGVLNGNLEFKSEENKGTEFVVTLPMTKQQGHPEVDKIKSVLIVDDIAINRKVLEYKLKDCNVMTASTGQEAINLAINNNFDIVLMDLQMPNMDGFQTTNILRNRYNFQNKIIAVTGHDISKEIIVRNGFTDILLKPIDFNKLKTFFK